MNVDKVIKQLAAREKRLKATLRKLEQKRYDADRDVEKLQDLRQRLDGLRPKQDGRPGTWKGQQGYDLFLLVEGMRKRTGCTAKHAIERLHEIKCPPCDKHTVRELRVRYSQDVKPYWAPRFREMEKIEAELAALEAKRVPVMTDDEVRELVNPGLKGRKGRNR